MTKRPSCKLCLRPLKTCICKHIRSVNNLVSLVILQHPQEVHEVKNSGRLAHLCLKNSQIHMGENFGDDFFQQLRNDQYYDLLLYPETPEEKSLGIITPPQVENWRINNDQNPNVFKSLRLWVLDATWRKSRKMLYLNPALQTMPRLCLDNCPPSLYTIRKAHSENQLSSLEASCYALQKLEAGKVDYSPVLKAFADFVAEQHSFVSLFQLPSSL
ncbi:DTW domain-containing protein [Cellvibrio zantedeschiae]|uniref:tRNA-uridine aminocarboxypropyltransferase n=1 Tax=Cellvibrio zantedeschiae TaxID=1237077 RepID=A0ABQ3B0S2_9GAMM|nr:tRNA-uridine aminocarboxypropyltransferase [Cellvibrio zantedeschiae]GGY70425.1 DTW domain-containing protein [Cellvibrio zantedeschiae]